MGDPLPAEDADDAFNALNRMVGQWAAERLQIYAITRSTWAIVSGTSTYTVGTSGTVNIARPVFIDTVKFQDTSPTLTTEYQISPLTDAAYEGLVLKTLTSPFPSAYWYNPTFPTGTLVLWPTPTSATLQGVIYAATAVTAFAALTTTVSLPPGYEELIVTGLALRLATPYARQVDPSLRERFMEARAIVKRANARLMDLRFESAALVGNYPGASWSIYTGP